MAAPQVSSSYPTNGATDVYLNKALTITFVESLDATTVDENTFMLINTDTMGRHPVIVSYDDSTKTVTLTLKELLTANSSYRIFIVGTDAKITKELKSADSTPLATSIAINFTTGTDLFDIDENLGKTITQKSLESELFLPQNIKAVGSFFTLDKTRPVNFYSDAALNLTGDRTIKFTFTENIDAATATGAVDVIQYPMLTDNYLGVSGQSLKTQDDTLDYSFPTPTISTSGKDLIITFDKDLLNNEVVEIDIDTSLASQNGNELGTNISYVLTTELYPNILTPKPIKKELRKIEGEDVRDTYISYLIHKNFIMLWEKTNRSIDFSDVPYAAWKYVFFAVILDIMEDQDYEKFLLAGTRRQLGDLNVSVDSLIGRLALKIDSAKKERDVSFQTLVKDKLVATGIISEGESSLEISRLWYNTNGVFTSPLYKYNQPPYPMSNDALSRQAKTNNPVL